MNFLLYRKQHWYDFPLECGVSLWWNCLAFQLQHNYLVWPNSGITLYLSNKFIPALPFAAFDDFVQSLTRFVICCLHIFITRVFRPCCADRLHPSILFRDQRFGRSLVIRWEAVCAAFLKYTWVVGLCYYLHDVIGLCHRILVGIARLSMATVRVSRSKILAFQPIS